MKRQYALYLRDIVRAITNVKHFISDIDFQAFLKDEKTKSAVVWQIAVIGEAVKQLPRSLREKHKEVPWTEMARMRDKIAHSYFGIRYEIVWAVITQRLPLIRPQIEKILKEIGEPLF
ncbi:MAG: DUF86 domain-containing protein [Ignavibacteriales bacterium]|nr:DUF86 domain-containing protein [Ignavibacteriales bacterium]